MARAQSDFRSARWNCTVQYCGCSTSRRNYCTELDNKTRTLSPDMTRAPAEDRLRIRTRTEKERRVAWHGLAWRLSGRVQTRSLSLPRTARHVSSRHVSSASRASCITKINLVFFGLALHHSLPSIIRLSSIHLSCIHRLLPPCVLHLYLYLRRLFSTSICYLPCEHVDVRTASLVFAGRQKQQ